MEKKPDLLKDQFGRITKALEEHWVVRNVLAMVKLMSQTVQQLRDEGLDITMETHPASITTPPFVRGTITLDGRSLPFTIGYGERGSGMKADVRNGADGDALAGIHYEQGNGDMSGIFQSTLRTHLLQLKAASELYAQYNVGMHNTSLPKPRAGAGGLKP